MGKLSIKKKKELIHLFPEAEHYQGKQSSELQMGSLVKILKPSNRYFQYIYVSLDIYNLKITDFAKINQLEGTTAVVSGMIQLTNGDHIAIINKKDGISFLNSYTKLYIDRTRAINSGEIEVINS